MEKTAPARALAAAPLSSAVGEAVRALEQVDSELQLTRLAEASRKLEADLSRAGFIEAARIADRITTLANGALRSRAALAPRELRALRCEYLELTRSLERPRRSGPPRWRAFLWASRLKGQS
jgi:hypothetical protein